MKNHGDQGVEDAPRHISAANPAPLEGEAVDQAPFLLIEFWLKNEQPIASHAGYGAATGMNGLSTDCSTVFVRKREVGA
ncbi:hypothetical protein ACYZT9_04365 [Pseudomonas sp. ZT5P21]